MTPDEVDAIPYRAENGSIINHKENERDEQELVRKHLKKDARVLELGARYGTVSCLISAILDDPSKHVAVEPDVSVLSALIYNKLTHSGKFHIVVGAISRTPVSFDFTCGYGNHTVPSSFSTVETFTLEEIEKRYDVSFNCLVADCEGFLEQFFRENPDFPSKLDMIIFESDGGDWCDYVYVKETLQRAGLRPVVDGFQSVWVR
jgi:FkbM family methyltransferase